METKTIEFILGPRTPEMDLIEEILENNNVPAYGHALVDNKRATPDNAHRIGGVKNIRNNYSHRTCCRASSTEVIFINCRCEEWPEQHLLDKTVTAIHLGHRWLGDPGYDMEPSHFFTASAIGQLFDLMAKRGLFTLTGEESKAYASPGVHFSSETGIAHLIVKNPSTGDSVWLSGAINQEHRLAAASSHCLQAAYRGECPKIDPDALFRFRIKRRSDIEKVDRDNLTLIIEDTINRLQVHFIMQDFPSIIDLKEAPLGSFPELREAAARFGKSVEVIDPQTLLPDAQPAIKLIGSNKPEVVAEWVDNMKRQGFEINSDPFRGYAEALSVQPPPSRDGK